VVSTTGSKEEEEEEEEEEAFYTVEGIPNDRALPEYRITV